MAGKVILTILPMSTEIRKVPQDSLDGGFNEVPVLQKKKHIEISGKLSKIASVQEH
jgi:hypothetical protein